MTWTIRAPRLDDDKEMQGLKYLWLESMAREGTYQRRWLKELKTSEAWVNGERVERHMPVPDRQAIWREYGAVVEKLLRTQQVRVMVDGEQDETIWAFACLSHFEELCIQQAVVKDTFWEMHARMLHELIPPVAAWVSHHNKKLFEYLRGCDLCRGYAPDMVGRALVKT